MSLDAAVGWCFLAAWLVVLAFILLVALPGIVRAALVLARHGLAIVNTASLGSEIAMAENNMVRINRALDRLPALALRAQAAMTAIRTTPVVPPIMVRFAGHLVDEYRAFRRSLR